MTPRLDLRALEVSVTIEAFGRQAQALIDACAQAWSSCATADDRAPDGRRLRLQVSLGESLPPATEDDTVQIEADTLESALEWVTQHITVGAIERRAGELLMLHACAVADARSGHAAVLVGPSGMGKTTLARHLGRRWSYLTDETAALRPNGSLVAYPKPLSIVSEAGPKRQQSPDELALQPVPDVPLLMKGLFLLDRRPGCAAVVVEDVPKLEAIALLAEHTSYLGRLRQPLRTMAGVIDTSAGVRLVSYTDAAQVESVIEDLFGDFR